MLYPKKNYTRSILMTDPTDLVKSLKRIPSMRDTTSFVDQGTGDI